MKKLIMVLILALCVPALRVMAEGTTPLQLSIWSPLQVFPSDWDVTGLRCGGIYSRNRQVYGVDVGLFNSADAASGGLQLGLGNLVSALGFGFVIFDPATSPVLGLESGGKPPRSELRAGYTGLQLSLLSNHADDMVGLQLAGICNRAIMMSGFQFSLGNECFRGRGWQGGLLNEAHREFGGIQTGGVNTCGRVMRGLQVGGVNICDGEMHGLQIGIINYAYAQKMSGVQIGLLNFIYDNPVPFLPGINAHF